MLDFTNRVVLITGGTAGIGRATAVMFAQHGAKVVVTGRREKEGLETVALIQKAGQQGAFVRADVSQENDCRQMVQFTLDKFGRLDCAFNNAGTEGTANLNTHEQTVENYRHIMDINVLGVLLSMKYEIAAMLNQGGGRIVNNASVLGLIALPGTSVYNASKHAVIGLTKTAALEYATRNITINCVAPAMIRTPMFDRFTGAAEPPDAVLEQLGAMHPVGRIGMPEEVASTVLYLCSPAASFMTGTTLPIDGGWSAK